MLASICSWSLALAATPQQPLDLGQTGPAANIALLQGPGLPDAVEDLYLEVYLNSVPTRRVMQVSVGSDRRLLAWADNLGDCGLRIGADQLGRYIALDQLPGLAYRYDAPNQRLYFDADPARLNVRSQRHGRGDGQVWQATVSPGALLNYDLYASAGEQRTLAAGSALRLFGALGVFESTGLSRYAEGAGSEAYVRLDSAWTQSTQDELLSLAVGDYVSGSVAWSRATRLAGVQLRRNFALQPGLLSYPVPQFFGEAALPSRIELYVNGVRQYEGETPPGPFQLSTPPSVSGAGLAQVVLTDALGRVQAIDFSFYNAPRLLRAGLSDFDIGLGAVRRNYGIDSFSYRDEIAASGSYAYGLNDWLTLESHGEAASSVWMAGAGGIARLAQLGTLRGSYARSDADSIEAGVDAVGQGRQFAVGYNYTAHGYIADYSLQRADRGFRDLAASEARAPNLRSEQALLGSALGDRANLSISYVRLDSADGERFRSLAFNASTFFWRSLSLYLSLSRDLDRDAGLDVFVGCSTSFGPRLSAGAGYGDSNGTQSYDAYVSAPVPADGGNGWQLRARHAQGDDGNSDFVQGDIGGRGDYGDWNAGLQSFDSDVNAFASASGSLVMMDTALFPSRRVDDGFALVTTNGVAHVPVLLENRIIGETDARGHYLLTGLNAYQPNRLAIDPLGLPAQIQASRDSATVVPADRVGVKVDFGLRESRSALLILHDRTDQPLALGSSVLRDGQPPAIVGFDGQTYLENLAVQNRITVVGPDGSSCVTHFVYPPAASGIPTLGPLPCEP